jgi:RES domain-containing protein
MNDRTESITMARLLATVERCRANLVPWSGMAFRSTALHYRNPQEILNGEGSRRCGGRWNPCGEFAAVYASLDLETAMAETLAHGRYYRLPERAAMPRVFWAIEVRLGLVLDLRNPETHRRLSISRRSLQCEDWRRTARTPTGSLTQAFGRAAFSACVEGLLVPSAARRDGTNLVVFPANLRPRSHLRIERATP